MKLSRSGSILLIILVLAALAVSGCSGGNPTTAPGATPTPTPTPGAGTLTPSPTWDAVDNPVRSDQMFHLDSLHWYQYRSTLASESVNLSSLYKFEYGDTTYNGTAAKHTRVIVNDTVNGLENVVDLYTAKADGRSLGGSAKSFIFGTPTTETGLPAGQGMNYLDNEYASKSRAIGNTALTASGSEKVTVDGKSYTCTKYTYTDRGTTYTAWYTSQAPAPVKVAWTDKGIGTTAHLTLELLGWG